MTQNNNAHYFLLFCLAASIVAVFFIIQPLLTPLVLAAVFAFLFQPLYRKFLRFTGERPSLSAFAATITAVIVILLPLVLLGTLILKESTELYETLAGGDRTALVGMVENAWERVRAVLPIPGDYELNISQYARQGLEALVQNLGAIFSSVAKMILNLFVFLTAFYFFLKDGPRLKDYFVALSPLRDSYDEVIVSRIESAVSATVKGSLAIGLIQGALTGVGFAIFGVPNPALWGSIAAIMALVPGLGTALVIGPAVIFLFLTDRSLAGTGLLIWGVCAVGLIDNFLGPRLVGRGMRMHPLAVFLAVLGGLAFFGPLGFVLGPLAMSLCMALIDIHFSLKSQNKNIA